MDVRFSTEPFPPQACLSRVPTPGKHATLLELAKASEASQTNFLESTNSRTARVALESSAIGGLTM